MHSQRLTHRIGGEVIGWPDPHVRICKQNAHRRTACAVPLRRRAAAAFPAITHYIAMR